MDYREIIRAEFQKRKSKEPFYSLRDFAKDLNINVSHLSLLFKGQRGLSRIRALEVGMKIGLTYREAKLFQALVSNQSGRGWIERGSGWSYLRRERASLEKLELEMRSQHDLPLLPPIIKKRRSRSW